MKNLNEKKIEDLLLKSGLITLEKLKALKERQTKTGEKIEKILLGESTGNYREVLGLVAKKIGVEYVDLENIVVNKDAIKVLTAETVKKYSVFPFDINNNMLSLAMQNPDEIFLIDEIKVYSQMEIKPYLADTRMISKAINYFYPGKNMSNNIDKSVVDALKQTDIKQEEENEKKRESNVDSIIRGIILKAIKMDASDIHIDNLNSVLRVRYRIDGNLIKDDDDYSINAQDILVGIKAVAGLLTMERTTPQKKHISYDLNKKETKTMDVMVLPAINGDKILIRLDKHKKTFSIEEIGMTEAQRIAAEAMICKKSGIIILSGKSCSGRTSTMFALLRKLHEKNVNIITLEKKVSEKVQGIHQFQIPQNVNDGGHELLKAISEHDADVIAVDSLFSYDLYKYCSRLALEGKLIFITSNYTNAFETIKGLFDIGVEPYITTSSLEGVITQQIFRRLCRKCMGKRDSVCEECGGTGYKGKSGLFEVFRMDSEYKEIIIGKAFKDLEKRLENDSNSLKNNCIRLINDGITSIEEMIRLGNCEELF